MANYTNRPELIEQDPENWKIPEGMPAPESESPVYAPGADQTKVLPSETPEAPHAGPQVVPTDPRLGMVPQGEWTPEKIKALYPEMFPGLNVDTSQWLDPAEEAKKRMGLPYDASKKYDEKKLYPGINAPYVPGLNRSDDRPPILKMSREQWEQHVFKTIGGNPALHQPYDDVIKADANLPELFQRAFPGISWSDIGKLDKDEKAHWENVKKEYHRRVLDESNAKHKQMEEAYKWMMGNWSYEQKQAAAELSRQDKLRAKQEAAAGKAPPHEMLYNDNGELTLHERQPDGRWVDTGKRGHEVTPRDVEPSAVKEARKRLAALVPPMTPAEKTMFGFMTPEQQAKVMASRTSGITPETQQEVDKLTEFLKKYDDNAQAELLAKMGKKEAGAKPGAAEGVTPASATTPVRRPAVEVLAAIGSRIKAGESPERVAQAVQKFKRDYSDIPGSSDRIDAMLTKLGWTSGVPALENTPAETRRGVPSTEEPSRPAPVKGTRYELPATTGPIDAARSVGNLDWTSPSALVKDVAGKIGGAIPKVELAGKGMSKLSPEDAVTVVVAAKRSGDPEFEDLYKKFKAMYVGTPTWKALQKRLEEA